MCQAFPYRVSGGPIDENLVEDGDALIYGAMALIRPLVWSSLSTGSINPSNITATYKNYLFSGDFLIVCQGLWSYYFFISAGHTCKTAYKDGDILCLWEAILLAFQKDFGFSQS